MADIAARLTLRRKDGGSVIEWANGTRFGVVIFDRDSRFEDATSLPLRGRPAKGRGFVDSAAELPAGVLETCRAIARSVA